MCLILERPFFFWLWKPPEKSASKSENVKLFFCLTCYSSVALDYSMGIPSGWVWIWLSRRFSVDCWTPEAGETQNARKRQCTHLWWKGVHIGRQRSSAGSRLRVVLLSISSSCVTRKKTARKQWPSEIARSSPLGFHATIFFLQVSFSSRKTD